MGDKDLPELNSTTWRDCYRLKTARLCCENLKKFTCLNSSPGWNRTFCRPYSRHPLPSGQPEVLCRRSRMRKTTGPPVTIGILSAVSISETELFTGHKFAEPMSMIGNHDAVIMHRIPGARHEFRGVATQVHQRTGSSVNSQFTARFFVGWSSEIVGGWELGMSKWVSIERKSTSVPTRHRVN